MERAGGRELIKEPQRVDINGKHFRPYISRERIAVEIARLGDEITRDYNQKNPLFVVVLKGSMIFAADLLRAVRMPCSLEFVRARSYGAKMTAEHAPDVEDPGFNCTGRDVIVLEDIVDTGRTISAITRRLQACSPNSVRVAALLDKPGARDPHSAYRPDYVGFEVENDFVVGYGLDFDEQGRQLADIYILES